MTSAICGSSPHTRGTHRLDVRGLVRARFIPAYAGNTRSGAASPSARTVHPRIRGERMVTIAVRSGSVGSSPHTRGTQPLLRGGRPCARVIPVYAGNAQATTTGPYLPDGSSPHTRGTRCRRPSGRRIVSAHPRIRGERRTDRPARERCIGSSPHTRGTRRLPEQTVGHQRFIPAYAGNAVSHRVALCGHAVHPRIRGERRITRTPAPLHSGSSPHTRGTLDRATVPRAAGRFIPAYAGNALITAAYPRETSVHPRIRGERSSFLHARMSGFGSSPHTRGTRSRPPGRFS